MSGPTFRDIHELRSALQRMIDAEYSLEASGDNGHYDVSEIPHVAKAKTVLAATEHLDRVEHISVLKSSTLDKLDKIKLLYDFNNDQAIEMLIGEHGEEYETGKLSDEYGEWLSARSHIEPGSADEVLMELQDTRERIEETATLSSLQAIDEDIAYVKNFCKRWEAAEDKYREIREKYRD